MQASYEPRSAIYQGTTPVLLARVAFADGSLLTTNSVDTATYRIEKIAACDGQGDTPVPGHEDVTLAVNSVLLDSALVDSNWSVDSVGYNFRHTPDASSQAPFPDRGAVYAVTYSFLASTNHPVVFRFNVEVI